LATFSTAAEGFSKLAPSVTPKLLLLVVSSSSLSLSLLLLLLLLLSLSASARLLRRAAWAWERECDRRRAKIRRLSGRWKKKPGGERH
jgi:hypothetical protein